MSLFPKASLKLARVPAAPFESRPFWTPLSVRLIRLTVSAALPYSLDVAVALRFLAISCICCFLLQSCVTPGLGTGRSEPIPLRLVVEQVTAAVNQFRNSEAAKYAELASAEFNFQTVKSAGAELKVNPVFFNFGLSGSREVTHTFTFIYTKPGHHLFAANVTENDMTRDLVEMIKQAARTAQEAVFAVGLPLNEVDLSVQFCVKQTVTGGGSATIQLITLGGSATASRSQTQSVKLSFKRK